MSEETWMEAWRKVWREGVAPLLSEEGLIKLREALETDDQRLCQGFTTVPYPHEINDYLPVEKACAISYAGWQGDGLETVGEVEEFFARMCFEIDQRLGEPAACRWFIGYFDETGREEVRKELFPEVVLALNSRERDYIEAENKVYREWLKEGSPHGRGYEKQGVTDNTEEVIS